MSLNSFRTGLGNVAGNPFAKWVLFGVGALLVFSLVFSGLGNNLGHDSGGGARAATDIIATVNGDPITRDDFDKVAENMRRSPQAMNRTIGVAEEPVFNFYALDQLVTATLQMQEAKRRNITVSDAEIKALRAQVADQQKLRETLSLPPTASLSDIDAALTKAGGRTLEETLPDDTLRQAIILGDPQSGQPGKLLAVFAPAPQVSEADVRQYYLKYHTRHILIGNKTRSDVQAKAQAEQILAKAKVPGADFAALARQYSEDPGTKAKGGDDNLIDSLTGYFPPEFKKAAFSLKAGEVAPDPVAFPQLGYYVIKLDGIQNTLPKDFDAKKTQYVADYTRLAQQGAQQQAQGKLQALITSLRDAAKIDIKDPGLAGDNALALAGRQGDPAKSQARYQEALADYQKALKEDRPALEKATLNASLGQVYQGLRQAPQALAAYDAAARLRPDPALELSLGKLYEDGKDAANAAVHYQKAGQLAWNDQGTHITLLTSYQRMGRKDLADGELTWLKQYDKDHPRTGGPAGAPGLGLPGGSLPGGPLPTGPPSARPAGSVRVTVPPPAPKPGGKTGGEKTGGQ